MYVAQRLSISNTLSIALFIVVDLKYINRIINNHMFISSKRQLLYVTDFDEGGTPTHTFEHRSCSFPGLLALGVHHLGISLPLREREMHLWAAQGLAHTCWALYQDQQTSLGPQEVQMEPLVGEDGKLMGKWVTHLEAWEAKGKKGTGPPGTKLHEPSDAEEREYAIVKSSYSLSAEVRRVSR